MIVLDANILIRAMRARRVRQLLETYAAQGLPFVAPDVAFAQKYLPPLVKKRNKSDADVAKVWNTSSRLLGQLIGNFTRNLRKSRGSALRDRDKDDWPVLAMALGMDCDVWSEDQDFFGTGVAVWTTNRIEILLRSQQAKQQG